MRFPHVGTIAATRAGWIERIPRKSEEAGARIWTRVKKIRRGMKERWAQRRKGEGKGVRREEGALFSSRPFLLWEGSSFRQTSVFAPVTPTLRDYHAVRHRFVRPSFFLTTDTRPKESTRPSTSHSNVQRPVNRKKLGGSSTIDVRLGIRLDGKLRQREYRTNEGFFGRHRILFAQVRE